MTGVELALLCLGAVMVAGAVPIYRRTHSSILVAIWVAFWIASAWWLGLLA